MYDLITMNRSPRMTAENKLGPRSSMIGTDSISKKTYIYKIHDLYNSIPRTITLIKMNKLFKKWIERYINNGEVRKNSKFIKDCTYIRTYNQIKQCEGYKIYVSNDNPGG